MPDKLSVAPEAWILLAALLLVLPVSWVAAAAAAGAVHEWFHLAALRWCRVPVYRMRIGPRGAALETGLMTPGQELLCALAGPAGSLLLLSAISLFPRLALWGLVQGLFNLIPLGSSDGRRALNGAIGLLRGKIPCKEGKEGVQ